PLSLSCTLFPYTTLFRSTNHLTGVSSVREFCSGCDGLVLLPDGRAAPRDAANPCHLWCIPFLLSVRRRVNRLHVRFEVIKRAERSEEHTSELQSRFDLVC